MKGKFKIASLLVIITLSLGLYACIGENKIAQETNIKSEEKNVEENNSNNESKKVIKGRSSNLVKVNKDKSSSQSTTTINKYYYNKEYIYK